MNRIQINSKTIKSMGFDHTQRTLEIEYSTGEIYQYKKVPVPMWFDLKASDAKGRFLHRHIKRFERVKIE